MLGNTVTLYCNPSKKSPCTAYTQMYIRCLNVLQLMCNSLLEVVFLQLVAGFRTFVFSTHFSPISHMSSWIPCGQQGLRYPTHPAKYNGGREFSHQTAANLIRCTTVEGALLGVTLFSTCFSTFRHVQGLLCPISTPAFAGRWGICTWVKTPLHEHFVNVAACHPEALSQQGAAVLQYHVVYLSDTSESQC